MKLVSEEEWEEGFGGMMLKLCLPTDVEGSEDGDDGDRGRNKNRNAFVMMLADQVRYHPSEQRGAC